jgi:hypothetical protein
MCYPVHEESAAEHGALCGLALVCYSTVLASLVVLGYSLTALALSAAGQQIAAGYSGLRL